MKHTITVTIEELTSDKAKTVSRHRTTDRQEAIRRAVQKAYGKRAEIWADVGLTTSRTTYGQIVVPATTGGWNCITGRVAIEASP